jgi:hypothetical protein
VGEETTVVELDGFWDYLGLFGLAAILGGLGGLAYELLQTRRGQTTGWVEVPHEIDRGRFKDWGVWANVVIGSIAAVAALWVFPPESHPGVVAGKVVTATEYDVVKVVGLSLIIGSAGSSFLGALQARALALVKDQEAKQTQQVAQTQLDDVKKAVESGAPHDQLAQKIDSAKTAVRSLQDSGPGNPQFD